MHCGFLRRSAQRGASSCAQEMLDASIDLASSVDVPAEEIVPDCSLGPKVFEKAAERATRRAIEPVCGTNKTSYLSKINPSSI